MIPVLVPILLHFTILVFDRLAGALSFSMGVTSPVPCHREGSYH
jgi:hypothetical protein